MTLLKAESWIGVGTSTSSRKWVVYGVNPTSSQTGRHLTNPGRAMRTGNTGWGLAVPNLATVILGTAYRTGGFGTGPIFWGVDSASLQWTIHADATGHIVARNGAYTGTILGTSANAMNINQWYYIECKVTVHNSTGVVVVRVNGVEWLNLTSQDTQVTANAYVNICGFSADAILGTSPVVDFMDMVILDTAGSSPTNDFLGDVRVEGVLPTGNGNSSQLVGQDANSTDNYLNVDEDAPGADDDTTYNESSTVSDKDTYVMGNVTPTSGTVFGVQIATHAKKTDAGARSVVSVARLSGTETDSAAMTLNSTYQILTDVREAKPGGGVWSITDVNNAEIGVKVNA